MMGLVTLSRLQREIGEPVHFECDFFDRTNIDEVQDELGVSSDVISLSRYKPRRKENPWSFRGRMKMLYHMMIDSRVGGYDLVVFLGGDDLSEYYNPHIWIEMLRLRKWTKEAPLVLLGQTIGPFQRPINRVAVRATLPKYHIFPRDHWCTSYLKSEFGLADSVVQSTDLAFADLPRQHEESVADEVLERYGLEREGYFTLIVSAIQANGYYTKDKDAYLKSWKGIVEDLLKSERLTGKKLVLLAHTHTDYYGDETKYIDALLPLIDPALRDRIVPVRERILQTRARFILGHGIFTITGRMHPAVSTFQMGKPAISLSYSKKYEGVIGTMLGRSDLIIEANDPKLWESGEIVRLTLDKVRYVLDNQDRLRAEIRTAIDGQKQIVDDTFQRLGDLMQQNNPRR
ncbi:MAG: polysaccharide pyruvyl transferase family protein [Sphingomonadaceae bacterium]